MARTLQLGQSPQVLQGLRTSAPARAASRPKPGASAMPPPAMPQAPPPGLQGPMAGAQNPFMGARQPVAFAQPAAFNPLLALTQLSGQIGAPSMPSPMLPRGPLGSFGLSPQSQRPRRENPFMSRSR